MRITVEELRQLKEMFSTKDSPVSDPHVLAAGQNYNWTSAIYPHPHPPAGVPAQKDPVPEVKAEEIVKPMSVLDDMSDEEILMYHSPRFDEIQAEKGAHKEKLAQEKLK